MGVIGELGGAVETERQFEELFARVGRPLMAQALVLTGSVQAAEDLVQETLSRAWQNFSHLRELDYPEAWCRRVLDNLAVDRWRRIGRDQRSQVGRGAPTELAADGPLSAEHLDVITALRRLPEPQRRALVLDAVVGLTTKEIALEMDASEGTVRSWLARARKTMEKRLS